MYYNFFLDPDDEFVEVLLKSKSLGNQELELPLITSKGACTFDDLKVIKITILLLHVYEKYDRLERHSYGGRWGLRLWVFGQRLSL